MEALSHITLRRPDPVDADARRRSDAVLSLLDEVAAIDARIMNERSAEARRALADRRDALAVALLHTLQAWRRRGGTVRCEAAHPGGGRLVDATRRLERAQPASPQASRGVLRAVLDSVELAADDQVELGRLHDAIRDNSAWSGLLREHRRGVVALFTVRLRRLQDDHGMVSGTLEDAFAMLTAYSKREQPGFVVGLSRAHQPVHGTWDADARAWWTRLEAVADGLDPGVSEEDLLDGVGRAGADPEELRRAIRTALDGGVSGRDPRLARLCAPHAEHLDDPEFRTLRRAISDLG